MRGARARHDDIGFRSSSGAAARRKRRDTGVRQALRDRILSEFREMPGMTLTVPQAARLLGISNEPCERILSSAHRPECCTDEKPGDVPCAVETRRRLG